MKSLAKLAALVSTLLVIAFAGVQLYCALKPGFSEIVSLVAGFKSSVWELLAFSAFIALMVPLIHWLDKREKGIGIAGQYVLLREERTAGITPEPKALLMYEGDKGAIRGLLTKQSTVSGLPTQGDHELPCLSVS